MTVSDYKRLFRYEFWANRTVADALSPGTPEAVRLFSHVLASESLWLDRLTGRPQTMAVWPSLAAEECVSLLGELERAWRTYLDELTDDALARRYDYVNSKGQPWTSTVSDTLSHLITHSCYHRGQIALRMRLSGEDPPYTDFIQATRMELL